MIGVGGVVIGAGVSADATRRAVRPYRERAAFEQSAALVERRYESYSAVVAWMRPYLDDRGEAQEVPFETRAQDAGRLRAWYYEQGGALLMSGDAFNAYRLAVQALLDPDASPEAVAAPLSLLRTELKTDIGSRQPQERDIPRRVLRRTALVASPTRRARSTPAAGAARR